MASSAVGITGVAIGATFWGSNFIVCKGCPLIMTLFPATSNKAAKNQTKPPTLLPPLHSYSFFPLLAPFLRGKGEGPREVAKKEGTRKGNGEGLNVPLRVNIGLEDSGLLLHH
jgi:hypothetical protein